MTHVKMSIFGVMVLLKEKRSLHRYTQVVPKKHLGIPEPGYISSDQSIPNNRVSMLIQFSKHLKLLKKVSL